MIRRRKKNKGAGAKMNDVKKEKYKEPVKKYMLAVRSVPRRYFKRSVKNGVTKCEQCHQRVSIEIENGIVHVAPYSSPPNKK